MAENYDDIDKKTPDTVDTDGHASDDKDNDDDTRNTATCAGDRRAWPAS